MRGLESNQRKRAYETRLKANILPAKFQTQKPRKEFSRSQKKRVPLQE